MSRKNTDDSEEAEMETKKKGSFCELCDKKFRSRYHLKLHSVVHTGEKNYLCGICRKSYQQKWNLITHMARVHGKEKPFRCNDCGKTFGYSSHFKRHIKTHFVEKMKVPEKIKRRILNPYKCEQCQKRFDSNYRLDIHIRKHSGHKPYMCDKCGMDFTTKRLVNNHITKHHLGHFVCRECGCSFPNHSAIAIHLTKVHEIVKENEKHAAIPKKDLIPCEVCGKTVMRASMKKHLNIHYRDRVYACRFCKKEFLESGQRVIHERKHTGEKPYICDLCGRGHSQYGNLLAHRKRCHNLKENPLSVQNMSKVTSRTVDEETNLKPEESTDETVEEFLKIAKTWINNKFEESKSVKIQSAKVCSTERSDPEEAKKVAKNEEIPKMKRSRKDDAAEKVKKQTNNKIYDKIMEDLGRETKTPGEKDCLGEFLRTTKDIPDNKVVKKIEGKVFWFCWICDGKFVNRHLLARHLLIHEPEHMRPYKCEKCGKTFTQSNNYKEHLMLHTKENQFYCEKCGNGFRHKSHFNVHVKKHEELTSGEKSRKFKCQHCEKTFNTNFHRNEHARTHTKEKPYLCRTCGRQFAAISTLNRHCRTHRSARFQCHICFKFFKQKSSLKRHESVHVKNPGDRVVCECGKSFSQKPSLKKHKLICERRAEPIVKPFPCVLCPKRFLTKSDLKRHTATHNTSRNFKCNICSVWLKTGETYSRHVRRHKNIGQ